MDQKIIIEHLQDLLNSGATIKDVDWQSGNITISFPNFPVNGLSKDELDCCKINKIEAIKKVRSNRGWTLQESKDFVEKHYDFVSSQTL